MWYKINSVMTVNVVKLFRYDNVVDLMFVDNVIRNCVMTNNSPLNLRQVKVHKGVDNEIRFRVLNPDRKTVSVDHMQIKAKLVSVENQERVLEKYCDLTSTKGDMRLRIFEGDLINIAPGYYNLIVSGQQSLVPQLPSSENFYTPFYVDTAGDIVATVEVVASADSTPWPSVTIGPNDWTLTSSNRGTTKEYYSSAIPGARVKNHINAVHTFAAYTTNFTGTLQLKASLDISPPENYSDYFTVDITTGTDIIEFENYTGVTSHTFDANFMWLRFLYMPDTSQSENGTMDKVMIR